MTDMKKTKNMIDKVTTLRWMPLLMALFFASCQSDDLTIPTDMPQGMKTVTVDFQLPEGKPGFEEGETRATTTDGTWANGDELLMALAVSNSDEENLATVYLTLKYDDSAWDVNVEKSYSVTAMGGVTTSKLYAQQPLLTATQDLSLTSLTLMLDENFGEVDQYFVKVYYMPDVKWVVDNEGNDSFQLKENATTTAPEAWVAMANNDNASLTLEWDEAVSARLRVHTGEEGDEVTLTSSSAFNPNMEASDNNTYTATTDKDGNAYFYGWMAEQTENFKLELTKIGGTALATPVTLLKASALVPVKLEAGKAYWLDASAKRNDVSQ